MQDINTSAEEPKSSYFESTRTFSSVAKRDARWQLLTTAFFTVDFWNKASKLGKITHYSAEGTEIVEQPLRVGDFLRLVVSRLGGVDWVRVEEVVHTTDNLYVLLRPSYDPTADPVQPNVTAHFFRRAATNKILLSREGLDLIARVIGINEYANDTETNDAVARARHRTAAETAWKVVQPLQWQPFVDNLLKKKVG